MIDRNITCSIVELAKFLSIDRTTLSRIQKEGAFLLVNKKAILADALQGVLKYYQDRSAGRNLQKHEQEAELLANRSRKMGAEAELALLKLAEARGALVSQDQIKSAWQSLLLRLRSELLALPERLSMQIDRETCTTIDQEIRSALTALADQGRDYE